MGDDHEPLLGRTRFGIQPIGHCPAAWRWGFAARPTPPQNSVASGQPAAPGCVQHRRARRGGGAIREAYRQVAPPCAKPGLAVEAVSEPPIKGPGGEYLPPQSQGRDRRDGLLRRSHRAIPMVVRLVRDRRGRRRILHLGVTENASARWVISSCARPSLLNRSHRFLICDDAAIFSLTVTHAIKSFEIDPKRTAFRSPWQNGTAERVVGSVRRELLDHVVVLNEDH